MNFRRSFLLGVVFLVGVSLVFSGCAGEDTHFLSVGTGGTAGVYYPLGGAMADLIEIEIENVNVSAQSTGASVENSRLIGDGEVEIAIIQNDIASYAYEGKENFADDAVTNLRGIATLYPEVIQIVVREEADIETIDDLRGKKVAVGAPGSGAEANAKQILNHFGITYDDLEEDFLSFNEAAGRLSDRQIDAAFVTAGIPTAAIMDVAASQDISILNFTPEEIASINEAYPYLTGVTVEAGTYSGQEEAANTVALQATLVVSEDLEEDLVYEMTNAIFENRDKLMEAHSRAQDITVETAQDGMTVPLHPGAKEYFDSLN